MPNSRQSKWRLSSRSLSAAVSLASPDVIMISERTSSSCTHLSTRPTFSATASACASAGRSGKRSAREATTPAAASAFSPGEAMAE